MTSFKGMVLFLLFLASQCFGDTSQAIPEKPDRDPNKSIVQKEEKNTVIELPGGVKLDMVYIHPGEFMMGSPQGSITTAEENECPQHKVRITKGFYLGKYEVTQAQWKAVTGTNPSEFLGENRPVENVSWVDCQDFIRKLNEITGKVGTGTPLVFRLPTEAEWEYSCRAGTTTFYYWGDTPNEDYMWYYDNSMGDTAHHDVGEKSPNAWGLYDMTGNVWEWCQDWYGIDYYLSSCVDDPPGPSTVPLGMGRVGRGGSWLSDARDCRSANRGCASPVSRKYDLGLRVVAVATEGQ